MTRRIAALAALLFLSQLTPFAQEKPKQQAVKEGTTCSLTKQKVEKGCCCEVREGKLYCTLAKKTIESCCCEQEKKAAPKAQ